MTDVEDPGSVSDPGGMVRDAGDKTSVPFDEEIYLRLNADVRQAVASGMFRSGRDHFEYFGRKEGRPFQVPTGVVRDRIRIAGNPDAGIGKRRGADRRGGCDQNFAFRGHFSCWLG